MPSLTYSSILRRILKVAAATNAVLLLYSTTRIMKTVLKVAGLVLILGLAGLSIHTIWQMPGVPQVLSRCKQLSLGMTKPQVLAIMGDAAHMEDTAILKGKKVRFLVFRVPFTIDPPPQVTFDEETGKARYIVCSERHRLIAAEGR